MRFAVIRCYTLTVKALSVIIPTYKRPELLKSCLEYLERQTVKDLLEIMVVSDGHDDATAEMMKEWKGTIPVQFAEVPKSQQGVARNKAMTMASAPLVLFIGDDILLTPGACEAHLKAHDTLKKMGKEGSAVLGFTTWDPTREVTPVMKWLETSGWQFGYPHIARYKHDFIPEARQHLYTYTSQISIKTDLAKKFPFKEDLTLYGWEDILWGEELKRDGIRLFYEPDAVAHHRHSITLDDSLKRMHTLGRSAVITATKYPHMDRVPRGWKVLAYWWFGSFPTIRGAHRRAFLKGVREAQKAAKGANTLA